MVDNRSAGFYGVGGSFNFRSGDISGTTANLSDEKNGQGNEYYAQRKGEDKSEQQFNNNFTDRSAQLRATLNSLAMLNVASVINTKKRPNALNDEKEEVDEDRFFEKTRKKQKEKALLEHHYVDSDEDEDEL